MTNKYYWWFYLPSLVIICWRILTPDLGEWDERFHALAAKNLSEDPFTPILMNDTLVKYDPNLWDRSNVWLAKPPFALWLMAGFIKVFGANEYAVRIPSLLFYLFSIYFAYIIGQKLYGKKIGFLTSFLFCYNGLLLEIYSGRLAGDHIDSVYIFLFQVIVWLSILFQEKKSIWVLVYLGVCIGLSFLTKWTMAFFPLIVSFLILLYNSQNLRKLLFDFFRIFLVANLVLFPWLYYLHTYFSTDFYKMLNNMITPIYQTIQNHQGNMFYYVDKIRIYINELIYFPLILLIYKYKHISFQRYLLIVWIFVPLLFLSLFETKRDVYILMSSTPMFVSLALFIRYFAIVYKSKFGSYSPLIIVVLVFSFSIRTYLERIHFFNESTEYPEYRYAVESLLLTNKTDSIILYREPKFCQIRYFYGLKAYPWVDDKQATTLRNEGYKLFELINGKYVER